MDVIVNPFDGEVSDNQIESWLEQFDLDERPYIVKLLPPFKYYSSHRYEDLLHQLFYKIKQQFGEEYNDCIYVPIGRIEDSGSLSLYLYQQGINSPLVQTQLIQELPSNIDKQVLLIDDFIETGQHVNLIWDKYIKVRNFKKTVYMIAVIGTYEGLEYLKYKTDFSAIVGETIDPPRPLQSESQILKVDDRKVILRIMQKYSKILYYPGVYSKKIDLCSLIGFFYNTPNSTFPIFWSTAAGWRPLLPHRSSDNYNDIFLNKKLSTQEKLSVQRSYLTVTENVKLSKDVLRRLLEEFHTLELFNRVTPIFETISFNTAACLGLMDLAQNLKHAEHEKSTVCASVFVPKLNYTSYYINKSIIDIADNLRIDNLSKAETIATVFDGLKAATVISPNGEILAVVIMYEDSQVLNELFPRRYSKHINISKDGLLFLFLGKDRVQLFANGEIIATHRGANWFIHSKEDIESKLSALSKKHSVPESVLKEVMRIAYLISDQEKGALLTLGNHENVLEIGELSRSDGYAWRKMNINQRVDDALIGIMSQDKATIIAANGDVLQGRTSLSPPPDPSIIEEPGKGTKHYTAAKTSKKTGAICFAISVSGTISVYSEGECVLRTII